jgi:hypothetical protein
MFFIKLLLLICGLCNLPFRALLIFLHGYLHLMKNEDNIEQSPDWIIAKQYLGIEGLPVWMHKIIGIAMCAFSIYWVNAIYNNERNMYTEIYSKFSLYVLLIILFEVIMKNHILG